MPKDGKKESGDNKARKPGATEPTPTTSGSGLNRVHLFLLVLIASIGFNCYVRWNKAQEEKSLDSGSGEKAQKLEKELKEANNLLELIKKDQVEIEKMFSLQRIVDIARKAKPKVRFSTNETKADFIAQVASGVVQKVFHSCDSKAIPVGEMDDYKNCFRDLAIELHNRLEMQLPESHFFVSAGRINYSFMVTTMHSKRQEYFITVGEILFELLEYDDLVTNTPEPLEPEAEPLTEFNVVDEEGNKVPTTVEQKQQQQRPQTVINVNENVNKEGNGGQ